MLRVNVGDVVTYMGRTHVVTATDERSYHHPNWIQRLTLTSPYGGDFYDVEAIEVETVITAEQYKKTMEKS